MGARERGKGAGAPGGEGGNRPGRRRAEPLLFYYHKKIRKYL